MTSALPTPTTAPPAPGVVTLAPPRRGKPPRHLADLTPAERAEAVAALGEKPFRGRQLSVHYFERLVAEPPLLHALPPPRHPRAARRGAPAAARDARPQPRLRRRDDGQDGLEALRR